MKNYKIEFGTGTMFLESKIIEVEDFENEQDAVDKMIDEMEKNGEEGFFIKWEDTIEEGGEYYDDEYIVGGNHGRILYHGGNFRIEEVLLKNGVYYEINKNAKEC